MAIQKVLPANPDYIEAFSVFYRAQLYSLSDKTVTYNELNGNADKLVFKGHGFKYEDGLLVDGTITSMTVMTSSGAKYATLNNFKIDVADLPAMQDYWPHYIQQLVLKGNDTLIGSSGFDYFEGFGGKDVIKGLAGQDLFVGGLGKDMLTGGADVDTFYLVTGDGHDTITDFQSADVHDLLYVIGATSYTTRKSGDDLILRFDNSIVVTLLDFKKSELDTTDVIMF